MADESAITGYAIDIGGTKTAVARIDAGRVVERRQQPTDGHATPDDQLALLAPVLRELGHEPGDRLGVAATGRVDGAGNWHTINQLTLSRVHSFPLQQAVERLFGPAAVLNDALAATLAEARLGAGQGCDHFAFVTVSTGVGGGAYLGGRLLRSPGGLAGHFGFMSSPFGQGLCGSGRPETVESVAGGGAIARLAAASGHPGNSARQVIEAARAGEDWAREIVVNAVGAVACLCADLTSALGIERVVFGGSIGLSEGYRTQVATKLLDEPELFRPELLVSSVGGDGPLLGALIEACDEN